MPPLSPGREPVLLKADYFYLLSWLIEKLGILKDDGLRILLIEELTKDHENGHHIFQKLISIHHDQKDAALDAIKQKAKAEIDRVWFEFKLLKNLMPLNSQ